MLQAVTSYLPVDEAVPGIGSLTYSGESRRKLALNSCNFRCPNCGVIALLAEEMRHRGSPRPPAALNIELEVKQEQEQEQEQEQKSSTALENRATAAATFQTTHDRQVVTTGKNTQEKREERKNTPQSDAKQGGPAMKTKSDDQLDTAMRQERSAEHNKTRSCRDMPSITKLAKDQELSKRLCLVNVFFICALGVYLLGVFLKYTHFAI